MSLALHFDDWDERDFFPKRQRWRLCGDNPWTDIYWRQFR